jgi:hypothetical protein
MNDLPKARWRKSSFSGNSGNCVEVQITDQAGAVAVRDSKCVPGPELAITGDRWAAFVRRAKGGQFDLPR